jgi:cytosine/adenosine deaminase-related metal-dependent hydrolase
VVAIERPAREAPPTGEYVIEADWVLVCEADEPRLVRNGSVRVVADRIEEVSDGAIRTNGKRIRARGQLLLPGFISGHTHTCLGSTSRGIIEMGQPFAPPYAILETFTDDEIEALTAFNIAELLRSGCTTHVEMSASLRQTEAYVRVARRWGVRGYPGAVLPWRHLNDVWYREDEVLLRSTQATLEDIEDYREYALGINGAENGLIRPMMTPHATDTHTPETLARVLEVARELGNGIHIHVAQSPDEVARVERLWGKRPLEWLAELGFFTEHVFAAHLWHADLELDIPLLRDTPTCTYAHCPSSLGAGGSNATQPWPEMLAGGVNTSIGIDTHSNDYVENIKLAVLDGRARYFLLHEQSAVPMVMPSPWHAVNAATRDAARGLGRDDLGRIRPGARADFCTVDVSGFLVGAGAAPPEPLNNLLYANGAAVRHVATDGVFQLWDGTLAIDDERRVIETAGGLMERLWGELADQGWFRGGHSHPPGWPYTWLSSTAALARAGGWAAMEIEPR